MVLHFSGVVARVRKHALTFHACSILTSVGPMVQRYSPFGPPLMLHIVKTISFGVSKGLTCILRYSEERTSILHGRRRQGSADHSPHRQVAH